MKELAAFTSDAPNPRAATNYDQGFNDALRWVLDVFNLDMENELELQRVLEGGGCEGRGMERRP